MRPMKEITIDNEELESISFRIGDTVRAVAPLQGISSTGRITGIRPDAVAWDYEVTFQDGTRKHFYRFQLTKTSVQ